LINGITVSFDLIQACSYIVNMNKFFSIQEAAKALGISPQTLRRWERNNKITPSHRTSGGQRRYALAQLQPVDHGNKTTSDRPTIAYARVSSHDQKEDLQRQVHMLEMYCSAKGWTFSVTKDLGSGMNYNKRGLKQLLEEIMNGKIGRLVLTHKDRLLRFGAELVFSLCAVKNVEVVIINQGDEPSFEEELAKDVLEIITLFSARLYGSRSHKNKQLIANLLNAVANV
jgi:putative resolvase